MGANDPKAWSIGPNGDHSTLLHTKYINCGSDGFRGDFNSYKPTYPATWSPAISCITLFLLSTCAAATVGGEADGTGIA